MREPVVSVIMITYNHENFIKQAIEGVLNQETNFPFELIIANDCSPDSTALIVENIINSHPISDLINFIDNKTNLGANRNYLNAYKESKGKYIAVCEGDDFWADETKLQRQVDFLEKNPEYVLTYHDAKCIDENGSFINSVHNSKPQKEFSKLELQQGNQPLFLTTCYRKVPIESLVAISEIINGDTFLTSILGNYGKGKWLNIKPAYYRHHSGGVWSLKQKEYKFKAKIQLLSVLQEYYKSKHIKELSNYFEKELFLHHKMLLNFYFKQKKYRRFMNYIIENYKSLIKTS